MGQGLQKAKKLKFGSGLEKWRPVGFKNSSSGLRSPNGGS